MRGVAKLLTKHSFIMAMRDRQGWHWGPAGPVSLHYHRGGTSSEDTLAASWTALGAQGSRPRQPVSAERSLVLPMEVSGCRILIPGSPSLESRQENRNQDGGR